ncbi:VOC family protein [Streptomonospora litoralis]|uniref:Glyoxalase-like domain protein n=1 Tax=Streptomonospora litoralis TaxID=2498135 RepID=A0A4P6Q786_9ACTN|nr:VOC family protein [Streptomonospora litoralis]QBI56615.1 Glyoxalase-like domain protein [Streptomonospora litoralis]
MDITLRYCQITVHDVDESLPFYRDALGLKVHKDAGNGVSRWVTLGSESRPGLEFVLAVPEAGRPEGDAGVLRGLLGDGALPMIVFGTDDLDAAFERVRESGAEVLQEPVDRPWGVRDSAFRDPWGNTVRIQQETAA